MAQLFPKWQKFVDVPGNHTLGIHLVEVLTSSDHFYVPKLAQRTDNSVCTSLIERYDENTATVTDNAATADSSAFGGNTVTVASGTVGDELLIVTCHGRDMLNSGDEN